MTEITRQIALQIYNSLDAKHKTLMAKRMEFSSTGSLLNHLKNPRHTKHVLESRRLNGFNSFVKECGIDITQYIKTQQFDFKMLSSIISDCDDLLELMQMENVLDLLSVQLKQKIIALKD